MMPVIRITDATWDRLKRWAEPLEDSPEDAARKVLEAAEEKLKCSQPWLPKQKNKVIEKSPPKSSRLRKGMKTPQQAYRSPILEAIYELGGKGSMDSVLKHVEEKMRNLLGDVDYQNLASGGDIRWRNTAQWERLVLVKDGLLKDDSPQGIWELSDKGIEEIGKDKLSPQ
jgi:hypothetical protein